MARFETTIWALAEAIQEEAEKMALTSTEAELLANLALTDALARALVEADADEVRPTHGFRVWPAVALAV